MWVTMTSPAMRRGLFFGAMVAVPKQNYLYVVASLQITVACSAWVHMLASVEHMPATQACALNERVLASQSQHTSAQSSGRVQVPPAAVPLRSGARHWSLYVNTNTSTRSLPASGLAGASEAQPPPIIRPKAATRERWCMNDLSAGRIDASGSSLGVGVTGYSEVVDQLLSATGILPGTLRSV